MVVELLSFLQELEIKIPPPKDCHHCVMVGMFGSDEVGWKPDLYLQVNDSEVFKQFRLEEVDFGEGSKAVDFVVDSCKYSSFKGQCGEFAGKLLPKEV